jgi:hypothetical protein
MNNLKFKIFNLLGAFLIISLLALLVPFSVNAMTLSPDSGTYGPQSVINVTVRAVPQSGENAVALRIQGSGLTITGYTPPSGWTVTTPDCAGSTYFTSTNVCASLGKTAGITTNESLGIITVRLSDSGSATLTGLAGNAYSDGTDTRAITGTLATFTIDTDLPTTLPVTSINDSVNSILLAGVGTVLLFLGAGLLMKRKTSP